MYGLQILFSHQSADYLLVVFLIVTSPTQVFFSFWICVQKLFTVQFFLFMHLMTHLTVPNPKSQFFPFSSASGVQHRFMSVNYFWVSICVLNEPSSILVASYSNRVTTDGAGWLGSPEQNPTDPHCPHLRFSRFTHKCFSDGFMSFSLWKWLFVKNFQVYSVAFKGEGLLISPSITRSTFCLNLQLYNVYEKTNAALSSLLFVLNWKPVNSCFSGD